MYSWFAELVTYSDVIMSAMAYQITGVLIVYSTVCSDQRKHQSSASLAFVRGIQRSPVNSLHKGPVTRKMFPFDGVIMCSWYDPVSSSWLRCCPRTEQASHEQPPCWPFRVAWILLCNMHIQVLPQTVRDRRRGVSNLFRVSLTDFSDHDDNSIRLLHSPSMVAFGRTVG